MGRHRHEASAPGQVVHQGQESGPRIELRRTRVRELPLDDADAKAELRRAKGVGEAPAPPARKRAAQSPMPGEAVLDQANVISTVSGPSESKCTLAFSCRARSMISVDSAREKPSGDAFTER